jgi:hypothetical protein
MPMIYKVLGQTDAPNTSVITLYTVPASAQSVISTIIVCNRSSANSTYNVMVRPAGATLANQHYVTFNGALPGFDTIALTLGLSLGNNDVISIQAATANNASFSVFGTEIY